MDDIPAGCGNQFLSNGSALLDIIIVNWNSGNQLSECLRSVRHFGYRDVSRVIIVDNASTDGSADAIPQMSNLIIKIIRNNKNQGFARACNQGAQNAKARYLLFLNPDTGLFEDSLVRPLSFMEEEKNKNFGICGIQLINEDGRVARTCARFPTFSRLLFHAVGLSRMPGFRSFGFHMKEWDHLRNQTVDHVIGAFFLVRRKLFEELIGFDERFFVYLEDLDFSFRAGKAGYKSMYLADTRAYHAGGGSSRQVLAMRLYYSLQSRLLYGFKHLTAIEAWVLLGVTIFVEPFSRIFDCLLRLDRKGIFNTLQGYRLLLGAMPGILLGRKIRK